MHSRPAADVLEAILKVYGTTHDLTQWPDYEEFYDELLRYYHKDPDALNNPLFQAECRNRNLHNDPERSGDSHHLDQAVSMAVRIFPQLLRQLLKADPAEASPGAGDAYSRFFDLLRTYSQTPRGFMAGPPTDHEFYLHTLNHDLFLENYFEEEEFQEAIDYSDGFSELGSPYFGGVCFNETLPPPYNRRPFNAQVRMPYFTGKFSGRLHLLKLHGSLDYWQFGVESRDIGVYEPGIVKKQPWVRSIDLYREIKKDGQFDYRRDFTNYYPRFLSGITAKQEEYQDPVLFGPLLNRFSLNLANSDVLVVIGYGFRDDGINDLMMPFLQNPAKKVIVIGITLPTHCPAIRPDMFHSGGLEGYNFSELENLLAPSSQVVE